MEFEITEEEKRLILKRRELAAKRKKAQGEAPKETPKQANGWDAHCEISKVHHGKVTEDHELYWFEDEIFKYINNLQHKEQHKLITTLLKMPVQNVYRDRIYHVLTHLDSLWEQEMLPLKYKIRYEEFKKKHGIGIDNVHENHKKDKPDYVHPIPVKNRPFKLEDFPTCDESEVFKVGKKYKYKAA